MQQTKLDDLKVKAIKATELVLAMLLTLLPLLALLYCFLSGNGQSAVASVWQMWLGSLIYSALPCFCGIVWLTLIHRRRRSLARYSEEPEGERKSDA